MLIQPVLIVLLASFGHAPKEETIPDTRPVINKIKPAKQLEPIAAPPKTRGVSSSGGCSLAYIAEKESGGSYTATNGQYTGKYQQSSGSWQRYGDGSAPTAGQASPASQEEAAKKQYAAEGSSPWSVC